MLANPTKQVTYGRAQPAAAGGIKLCSTSDLASVDTHSLTHTARLLAALTLFLERESDTHLFLMRCMSFLSLDLSGFQ